MTRKKEPDHYVYVETGSKNRSGGLKELNVENKVVPVYASAAAGERCLVYLLDLYLKSCLLLLLNSIGSLSEVSLKVLLNHGMHVNLLESISLIRWWLRCAVKQVLVIEKLTIRSG